MSNNQQSLGGISQGRSQEFVSEGDKRVGSVTIAGSILTQPLVGSGAKHPKHEKMLKTLLNVTNSILFRQKVFQRGNIKHNVADTESIREYSHTESSTRS